MPIIQSGAITGESRVLLTNSDLIMISSLELHIVYGIVMGAFFGIAVQVSAKTKFTISAEA
jgi:hypothetical protein